MATASEIQDFADALAVHLTAMCTDTRGYRGYLIDVQPGNVRTRLVRRVIFNDGAHEEHGSAYAFIEHSNGDIYRPDGWKKPAKHARGNIHADDRFACCGQHGVAYLR